MTGITDALDSFQKDYIIFCDQLYAFIKERIDIPKIFHCFKHALDINLMVSEIRNCKNQTENNNFINNKGNADLKAIVKHLKEYKYNNDYILSQYKIFKKRLFDYVTLIEEKENNAKKKEESLDTLILHFIMVFLHFWNCMSIVTVLPLWKVLLKALVVY